MDHRYSNLLSRQSRSEDSLKMTLSVELKYLCHGNGVKWWVPRCNFDLILNSVDKYRAIPLAYGVILWNSARMIVLIRAIAYSVFSMLNYRQEVSLNILGNPSFMCSLGSRILFNSKEAGQGGQNEGTRCRIPSLRVSEMEFVEPANAEGSI